MRNLPNPKRGGQSNIKNPKRGNIARPISNRASLPRRKTEQVQSVRKQWYSKKNTALGQSPRQNHKKNHRTIW